MALSDCAECWDTPCRCGHDFKNSSREYKELMTKSVNGHTIKDVFQWLSAMNYLTDDSERLYHEFIHRDSKK
jgi:hypothetical protein